MEAKYARSGWNLQAGGIVSIDDADGWEVTLERGHAWLTLEGYSQDKWLRAGERFHVPGAGQMVIEADCETRLRLDPPPAGTLARFAARLLAGTRQFVRAAANATVYSAERISNLQAR